MASSPSNHREKDLCIGHLGVHVDIVFLPSPDPNAMGLESVACHSSATYWLQEEMQDSVWIPHWFKEHLQKTAKEQARRCTRRYSHSHF